MSDFHIRLQTRNNPESVLIQDICDVAKSLGVSTLSIEQYNQHGKFSASTLARRFGSWNKALQKSGLLVGKRNDVTDEELFENLAAIWTTLGRQPLLRDISKSDSVSLFSGGTYEKRFGSWNKSLMAFAEFINANKDVIYTHEPLKPKSGAVIRRTKREINWRLRAKVLIKDSCICKMCGDSPAKNPSTVLHVDHIIAWANGGETVEENLQTLCAKCNIGKSDAVF